MPNGISVSSIRDSILVLLYDSLLGLMSLWADIDDPVQLIKRFLHSRLDTDFDIDRVGIFRINADRMEFVIGIGREPERCDVGMALTAQPGKNVFCPEYGIGYDLFIRVGDHVFCFDDTGNKRRFAPSDAEVLERVANAIHLIMMAKLEAAADRRLALQDPLTGLPNRRGFAKLVDGLIVGDIRHFQVGVVDIDNFKQVNDGHSHDTGDRIIMMVAGVLGGMVRKYGGVAARTGGDEFVVLFPQQAEDRFEEIRAAVEADRTVFDDGEPVSVTVTIGCDQWHLDTGSACSSVVDEADRMLLFAKKKGRNRVLDSI